MTKSNFKDRKTVVILSALFISLVLCGCGTNRSANVPGPESNTQVQPPPYEPPPTNGSEALVRLQEGNDRFVAGRLRHDHQSEARRKELVAGQHPFATVLSCSDSRVPTELVFDQGLGDVFVIRVAGNVAAPGGVGSIEYAVVHVHTPLLLVLGHESCGAITAALLPEANRNKEPKEIQELLAFILPSLKDVDPNLGQKERVSQGVEANVRATMLKLQNTPELKEQIAGGHMKIAGGVYELETGKVHLLN